ncbi:MAG: hypothetical protein NUV83_01890 [Candidatus Wolfebacteria bacterium]|nr:hypothetical protein [Candidatus Wolfebacteria bacterium]
MPLVQIFTTRSILSAGGDNSVKPMLTALPKIIAEHLSIPVAGGKLTPNDIIVRVNQRNDHDYFPEHFEVIIEAQEFPERLANLNERAEKIADDLYFLTPRNIYPSVWLTFKKGVFVETRGRCDR